MQRNGAVDLQGGRGMREVAVVGGRRVDGEMGGRGGVGGGGGRGEQHSIVPEGPAFPSRRDLRIPKTRRQWK